MAADEREPLDRDRIVVAAVALADTEGLGALTMRNLARRLGFEVMSLYNHVANKDDLLTMMVDAVASEIDTTPAEESALARIRAIAVSTHDVLVEHPWAPDLWLRHMPGPARTALMEHLLQNLAETGLSPDIAHQGFHAVNNHVLGYTLQELEMSPASADPEALTREFLAGISDGRYPHMVAHVHQHLDGDTARSFELVLDLILDGLVRLDAAG